MLLLVAAAIAFPAPGNAPRDAIAPVVQARATVRIVHGARIEFEKRDPKGPARRPARIRTESGFQTAQLVEFE